MKKRLFSIVSVILTIAVIFAFVFSVFVFCGHECPQTEDGCTFCHISTQLNKENYLMDTALISCIVMMMLVLVSLGNKKECRSVKTPITLKVKLSD